MGLSFHDQKSLEQAVESLHFAHDPPTPNSETGSIDIVGQQRWENDFGIERINDTELVARWTVTPAHVVDLNASLPTPKSKFVFFYGWNILRLCFINLQVNRTVSFIQRFGTRRAIERLGVLDKKDKYWSPFLLPLSKDWLALHPFLFTQKDKQNRWVEGRISKSVFLSILRS